MLKEIKSVLGIELSEDVQDNVQEIKLAQMTLENGTIIEAEEFAPEFEVFIVTEEDRIALPVGDYALEDGMILVVESEGIIKEIKEMELKAKYAFEARQKGILNIDEDGAEIPLPTV